MKKLAATALLISANALADADKINLICAAPSSSGTPDDRRLSIFIDRDKRYASLEWRFKGAKSNLWNSPEVCPLERFVWTYRISCGERTWDIVRLKSNEQPEKKDFPGEFSIRMFEGRPKAIGIEWWCSIAPEFQDI